MILKRMKKMKSMNWVVLAVLVAEMLFSESISSQQDASFVLIRLVEVHYFMSDMTDVLS